MKYLLLDNLLHTIELNYDDRIVLVNNTFIQYGNYPLTEIDTLESQKALTLMYGDHSLEIIHELLKPMHDMSITYGEILALRMIMLWNPGSIGLTPQTIEIVQRASEKAIKELQNWFEINKMDDGKTRLANLLLLLTPLAKHTQCLTDITSTIPGFGVMQEWDLFMSDLLRSFP
uniref:NR LBD domain-containing protein n=1 Tax=Acrobeloides nanus TaxID=290746 RepID=A0A914CX48_9BILA